METKAYAAPLQVKAGDRGQVQALFSTYTPDSVGDVVVPGAFQSGQTVPMAAWGHNWGDLPAGKGVIRETPEGAVFDGQFFMETEAGRETYLTVKAMGETQEWSFGFRVLDSAPGDLDGKPVTFLRKLETFEVSPVLVGANRATRTLAVKGAAAGVKDGRVLSTANRSMLAELHDYLEQHATDLGAHSGRLRELLDATEREDPAAKRTPWHLPAGQVAYGTVDAADVLPDMVKAARWALNEVMRVQKEAGRTPLVVWPAWVRELRTAEREDYERNGLPSDRKVLTQDVLIHGCVDPLTPTTIYLNATGRDALGVIRTVAHECRHVAQFAERGPASRDLRQGWEEEADDFADEIVERALERPEEWSYYR